VIRRAYVDAPTGQIHYRVAGSPGGTPLILLHQSPSSSAMWDSVLPEFARLGYYAIAPDLIGHGASDAPRQQPGLVDYAIGVWQVVDALGIETTRLLGHHSGASVAIVMATQQPQRVSALALWGVALMNPERRARLGGEGPPDWEHAPMWLGPRWESRRAASGPGWTPEIGRRSLLELMQAGPNSQWLHNAVANTPIESYLPMLHQPLLTVCGELDTLYTESEHAASLAPRGCFVPMHGTALDVADQAAAALVDVVEGFFRTP
jgi:haloalkane dehalogenase